MATNLSRGDHERDIKALFNVNSQKFRGGKSCLQIGCRSRKGFKNFFDPFSALGFDTHDVLEAHKPNVDKLNLPEARAKVCGDALKIKECRGLLESYDIIVWWHGPEHVKKDQFERALPDLISMCNIGLVIGCPNGKYDQGAIHGNPFEQHKHHWLVEEFEALGFEMWTFGTGKPGKKEPMIGVLWK